MKGRIEMKSNKNKIIDAIKTCFQKTRMSTLLLIFSVILFLVLAPISILLSTNYGIIYSLKLLIPICVFAVITVLTYNDKIKINHSKIISIMVFIFLAMYLYGQTVDCIFGKVGHIPFVEIIGGYNYKEEFYDSQGWQDFTDYCKYYYDSNADEKFKESDNYKKVENVDVSSIIEYFNVTERSMEMLNRSVEYDFDANVIDNQDYVYIKNNDLKNFSIYFYDMQRHILYYIHRNI